MPHQSAVTVLATVLPARGDDVREVLDEANQKEAGEVFRFAEVKGAHFARLVLVPQRSDSAGALLPAGVVSMSEVDVSPSAHLTDLVRGAGEGLAKVADPDRGPAARSAPPRRSRRSTSSSPFWPGVGTAAVRPRADHALMNTRTGHRKELHDG
ncbi:hypothetical protein AB0K49_01250 [Streptomyces decoyicus]|uniref:hypothetical protein n=1 Tax=Streptomyces decoyicus TaxID=249567 RepID=UPI00345CE7F1